MKLCQKLVRNSWDWDPRWQNMTICEFFQYSDRQQNGLVPLSAVIFDLQLWILVCWNEVWKPQTMTYYSPTSVLPFMTSACKTCIEIWCIIMLIFGQTLVVTFTDRDPSMMCDMSLESYPKTIWNDVKNIWEIRGIGTWGCKIWIFVNISYKLTSEGKMDWYPYQQLSLTYNDELYIIGKTFETPRQWHIIHQHLFCHSWPVPVRLALRFGA